jgi:hypothetical protein
MIDGSLSPVTTDDEPDKVFIHVLSTIGIREEKPQLFSKTGPSRSSTISAS